jgi:hypothetical protein
MVQNEKMASAIIFVATFPINTYIMSSFNIFQVAVVVGEPENRRRRKYSKSP